MKLLKNKLLKNKLINDTLIFLGVLWGVYIIAYGLDLNLSDVTANWYAAPYIITSVFAVVGTLLRLMTVSILANDND